MIRGTTPTLEFTLPFDVSTLMLAYITFSQSGAEKVEKTLDDCEKNGNKLIVKLTQEDTLALSSGDHTEIQIRAKTFDGEAIASNIIRDRTDRILKDGVI